jgi:hypothetical protein
MEEIPDVLCINCESMIDYLKLEAHSQVCYTYTAEVKRFDNSPYLSHINFRIIKLKTSLEAILYFSTSSPAHFLLQDLIQKANEIITLQSYSLDSIDKATATLSQIRNICEGLPEKYSVYSDRLKVLASNKVYHILDVIGKGSERSTVKALLTPKFHFAFTRKSLEHNRNRSDMRVNSYESSEDLTGVHEARQSIGSSIGSPLQFSGIESEDSSKVRVDLTEHITQDNLRKYFYSKCLIVKLSFSSRHPAQYIQISELYNKVLMNQVAVNDWERFIKDEFNHPERWVNLDVIPTYEKFKC